MLPLIGLLEKQICTELLNYTNLYYHLAVLFSYLSKQPRTLYTITAGGNISTINFNPEASEEYQLYHKEFSLNSEPSFSIFVNRIALTKEHLQNLNKEHVYSRNKRLLTDINLLAAEYDKRPEGMPFYFVAPFLFFNQEQAIAAESNGHTAWVRYDPIKKSLKIKSYFNGRYFEVLNPFYLGLVYNHPVTGNILNCSLYKKQLFPIPLGQVIQTERFPITYHIYKGIEDLHKS